MSSDKKPTQGELFKKLIDQEHCMFLRYDRNTNQWVVEDKEPSFYEGKCGVYAISHLDVFSNGTPSIGSVIQITQNLGKLFSDYLYDCSAVGDKNLPSFERQGISVPHKILESPTVDKYCITFLETDDILKAIDYYEILFEHNDSNLFDSLKDDKKKLKEKSGY